eukprot:4206572-Alexandrium_andersonii.AAC.1
MPEERGQQGQSESESSETLELESLELEPLGLEASGLGRGARRAERPEDLPRLCPRPLARARAAGCLEEAAAVAVE